MMITAQYLDEEGLRVSRSDMPGAFIKVSAHNQHWRELVQLGVVPRPYVAAQAEIPHRITKRQAIIVAVRRGWITRADAVLWASGGGLPGTIRAALDRLGTPAERAAAEITLHTMRSVERGNAILNLIATEAGATSADVDQAFIEGAQL